MSDELKDEFIASVTQKILSTLQRQEFADWYADDTQQDQHRTGEGVQWTGSLLRQPICMAWDS
jgi:hypothetical protein